MKLLSGSQAQWTGAAGLLCLLAPTGVQACATCFGAPESPLTHGLNMGILSLLVVVLFVLGGAASFFIYLAKRAAAMDSKDSRGTVLSEATSDTR